MDGDQYRSVRVERFLESLGPLGQSTNHGLFFHGDSGFLGGHPRPGFTVRDVVHHAGAGSDGDALSYLQVVAEATATTDPDFP
mgnify:CR=1 FL=1